MAFVIGGFFFAVCFLPNKLVHMREGGGERGRKMFLVGAMTQAFAKTET